jgi:glycosyltransferase involved in cell wall biosynthesis
LWVVAAVAHHGGAAPSSGRPYACWIGTTLGAEWQGRRTGLTNARRAAAAVSIGPLHALERRVLTQAQALYATGTASREDVAAAAGIDKSRIGILPIPVDSTHFTPAPDDLWLRSLEEQPTIAFVGRAGDPRKNVSLLLAAYALVRRELPAARVRLIGAPPAYAPPAGVDCAGRVPDVAAALRDCHLLVLPSFQEGFGIVVAEALACGVPAVVTPARGPEALVRASGGGTVLSSFEAAELADVLLALLRAPGVIEQRRRRGRAYVEAEHSPERFWGLLEQAMRALDG